MKVLKIIALILIIIMFCLIAGGREIENTTLYSILTEASTFKVNILSQKYDSWTSTLPNGIIKNIVTIPIIRTIISGLDLICSVGEVAGGILMWLFGAYN